MCGGGGKSPFWSQMLSDVYGIEMKTVACTEGPAFGAAILATVAAGAFSSVESACKKLIQNGKTYVPNSAATLAYAKYYEIFKSLYPCVKEIYAKL